MAIHRIGGPSFWFCLNQVCGDLMAEQVEINPPVVGTTDSAAQ
jgi:hypothetical protein